MNYSEHETQQEEKLSRGLGISFAVHAILIAFFAIKAVFLDSEPIDFTQAIRVDMVGLPDKIDKAPVTKETKENPKPALPDKDPVADKPEPVKQTAPAKTAVVKAPKAIKSEGINLEKNKSKQQSALEKLKAMAALEKIKEDVAKEKPKPSPGSGKDKSGSPKFKGNVLSPGTALTGLAKLQHDTYAADLDHHIKQNWALPEWLANRDFKAQVKVYFDARGNILGRKIVKSSGNPSYDDEVLATIDRSAPFPPPPDKFVSIVEVDGILIGFPE